MFALRLESDTESQRAPALSNSSSSKPVPYAPPKGEAAPQDGPTPMDLSQLSVSKLAQLVVEVQKLGFDSQRGRQQERHYGGGGRPHSRSLSPSDPTRSPGWPKGLRRSQRQVAEARQMGKCSFS